jgi:hypothetical protein
MVSLKNNGHIHFINDETCPSFWMLKGGQAHFFAVVPATIANYRLSSLLAGMLVLLYCLKKLKIKSRISPGAGLF